MPTDWLDKLRRTIWMWCFELLSWKLLKAARLRVYRAQIRPNTRTSLHGSGYDHQSYDKVIGRAFLVSFGKNIGRFLSWYPQGKSQRNSYKADSKADIDFILERSVAPDIRFMMVNYPGLQKWPQPLSMSQIQIQIEWRLWIRPTVYIQHIEMIFLSSSAMSVTASTQIMHQTWNNEQWLRTYYRPL